MTRGLRRALVLSILFHLLVLVSARQLPWLPDLHGSSGGKPIAASLRPVARVQAAGLPAESSAPLDHQKPSAHARELLKSEAGKRVNPVSQEFSPSTATDDVAVVERPVAVPPRPVTAPVAAVAQSEAVSLDGVRQYRLNLAREARQSKVYPGLARERGWEGVVVVVVTTVAGVALPQVTISQSSGIELLDRAATELVELAVQSARMPESLRGQQFALTLPIHYQLAD